MDIKVYFFGLKNDFFVKKNPRQYTHNPMNTFAGLSTMH